MVTCVADATSFGDRRVSDRTDAGDNHRCTTTMEVVKVDSRGNVCCIGLPGFIHFMDHLIMPPLSKFHSLTDAQHVFFQNLPEIDPQVERLNLSNALGRVLAQHILSAEFLPAFSRSTVDGYAVRFDEVENSTILHQQSFRLTGEVPMGAEPDFSLKDGEAALIHTGGMLPEGCNAVVMLENSSFNKEGFIATTKQLTVNENVIVKGEDVKPGDQLITKGSLIRVEEVAGLLALGLTEVEVFGQPKIAILSSGDEVVPPDQKLMPGQVHDINTGALAALVAKSGGIPITYPIVPDNFDQLETAVRKAFGEADVVVITAGSSASVRDVTAEVVAKLGNPGVLVHGIKIRPGKPTILAVCDGKPVIGLPGNPISALIIARLFLTPLIQKLNGLTQPLLDPGVKGILTKSIETDVNKDEFIPVIVRQDRGIFRIDPIEFKSNLIFNLVKANGIVHVPAGRLGFANGEEVHVTLL